MNEYVKVWCDLNTPIHLREDGAEEITTAWVEGLELRQEVMLVDEDWFGPGIVCGIKDHGRGKFLIVEIVRNDA